jgi:hypothetical protein
MARNSKRNRQPDAVLPKADPSADAQAAEMRPSRRLSRIVVKLVLSPDSQIDRLILEALAGRRPRARARYLRDLIAWSLMHRAQPEKPAPLQELSPTTAKPAIKPATKPANPSRLDSNLHQFVGRFTIDID